MRYFDGLAFRMHLDRPGCDAWCRKRFDYCVLDYAHSGRVGFSMDGSRQRILNAPVAWWTWPGPLFSFGALRGEVWHHHFVSFEGPRSTRMLRGGLLPPRSEPWARPRRPEEFRSRMLELFAALEAPQPEQVRAVHLLEGLLLELHRPSPEKSDLLSGALEELAAAMRRNPGSEPDLERCALGAGCSLVHFRRKFREQFGAPPGRFLQGLRLESAADLLRSTSGPIKEIAAEVGFGDVLYFTKLFRRRFDLPPARYRRRHHDWAGSP